VEIVHPDDDALADAGSGEFTRGDEVSDVIGGAAKDLTGAVYGDTDRGGDGSGSGHFELNPKTETRSSGTHTLNGEGKWMCPETCTAGI